MQSLAQFQAAPVAYTTGGTTGGGRPPSAAGPQPQLYATNVKSNNPVIQVRHKVSLNSGA